MLAMSAASRAHAHHLSAASWAHAHHLSAASWALAHTERGLEGPRLHLSAALGPRSYT
jgi:hypothetical protein